MTATATPRPRLLAWLTAALAPLVGVGVVLFLTLNAADARTDRAMDAQAVARQSSALGDVVVALQIERGVTAGSLGAPDAGFDPGEVRPRTDAALDELAASLSATDPPPLSIDAVTARLHALRALDADMDPRATFLGYTALVGDLIDHHSDLLESPGVTRGTEGAQPLLELSENVAQTRGLMVGIIARPDRGESVVPRVADLDEERDGLLQRLTDTDPTLGRDTRELLAGFPELQEHEADTGTAFDRALAFFAAASEPVLALTDAADQELDTLRHNADAVLASAKNARRGVFGASLILLLVAGGTATAIHRYLRRTSERPPGSGADDDSDGTPAPAALDEFVADSLTTRRTRILALLGLAALVAAVAPAIIGSSYRGSSDLHAAMEIVGGLIGLVAGAAFVARFVSIGGRPHLYFGLAFGVGALEDIIHGILPFIATRGVEVVRPDAIGGAIPATFLAGRLLTAGFLLVGALIARRQSDEASRRREAWHSILIGMLATAAVTTVLWFAPLGDLVFSDQTLARPLDVAVGMIFVTAFAVMIRNYVMTGDVMQWWMAAAALLGALGQATMGFSDVLYDAFFDTSHLIKVFGYLAPLVAVIHFQLRAHRTLQASRERGLELNHRLALANRDLERFASVASHDLQEPLRSIDGLAQIVQEDYAHALDDEGLAVLDRMRASSQRMRDLVDELLTLSRLGNELGPSEPVDTDTLVDEVCDDLSAILEDAGAVIERPASLPLVVGHPALLRLVFSNLITNAAKFRHSERPPVVRITAEPDGEDWCFTVSDNGIGIADNHRDRVFGAFQRLHPRSAYPGIGIGLATVHKAVLYHQGRIWIDGAQDEGTNVHFTIPRARNRPVPQAPHSRTESPEVALA